MSLLESLKSRAFNKCELCSKEQDLRVFELSPEEKTQESNSILVCGECDSAISSAGTDNNYWRSLSETIWSEHTPVKVASYRILAELKEAWSNELLEQIYLEDDDLKWARSTLVKEDEGDTVVVKDSNGTQLLEGDSVTLIKDLDVKGAGFTAKRGTLVKNISLTNNPKHIEGKVNGVQIVLVAAYLKKA